MSKLFNNGQGYVLSTKELHAKKGEDENKEKEKKDQRNYTSH